MNDLVKFRWLNNDIIITILNIAYHGAANRLAPLVHFPASRKTAYCNGKPLQFVRLPWPCEAIGTGNIASALWAGSMLPAARIEQGTG